MTSTMSNLPWMVGNMLIIRYVAMGCAVVFAIFVLGANAHYIGLETTAVLFVNGFQVWPTTTVDAFAALGVAVAAMALIFVNPMFIIDFFRRGPFTSYIVTELSVLGFLSIMWLATASYTTSRFAPIGQLCSENSGVSHLQAACTDIQLSMAFSWLSWLLILAYWITLLIMAILASKNGKPVWKLAVRDNDFGYSNQKAPSASFHAVGMQSNEQFLMQNAKPYASAPSVNAMAYNAPQVNSQPVRYDPPRQTGYGGYNPAVAQV